MKKTVFLLAFITLFISSQAYATYTCIGSVKGLTIGPKNGQVFAENIAGIVWPILCSVDTPTNGITVTNCQNIYSMLLAAQMSNKEVTLWFNDDAAGGSCQSHPSWDVLTGWYFGPKLNG